MSWVISSTSVLDRTDSRFFATIFGARQTVVKPGRNCKPTKTAASHGRRRLVFLTRLYTERSTWTPTAIFLSAAKGIPFTAFARAMRSSGARRQLLTKAPPSTWVATSVAGESTQQDWTDSYSWRLIVPAA